MEMFSRTAKLLHLSLTLSFLLSVISMELRSSVHDQVRSNLSKRREVVGKAALFLIGTATLFPSAVLSLSPEEAATAYDSYAEGYDALDGGRTASLLGIDDARHTLLREAFGSVLEIGAGTGLNLDKYDLRKVSSLTLLDVSEGMLNEAKKRVQATPSLRTFPIQYIKADATSELRNIFGGRKFDCVVDSFSLCVMGDIGAKRCLEEMSSVVKLKNDGGKILLLENTRSPNPLFGIYQDTTANAAAMAGGKGCVYNQDVSALINAISGMSIESERQYAAGLFRSYKCVID